MANLPGMGGSRRENSTNDDFEQPYTRSSGQRTNRRDKSDTGPAIGARRSETLVIYHNGHEAHWLPPNASRPLCLRPGEPGDDDMTRVTDCWVNYDTTLGWLNELGYDAMELNMPLRGPNNNGSIGTMSHSWFERYERRGVRTMKFFLDAVVLAVNYATTRLGYKRVAMIGLSGGGWTTTVAAAIDPRIGLSIPVAGSVPFDLRYQHAGDPYHDIGDFEQSRDRPVYGVCNYTCMYALAALEPGRNQLQILHEDDPCCFGAGARPDRGMNATRHAQILGYNQLVQASAAEGYMCTAVTTGNVHEVNLRDKTIIAVLLEEFHLDMLNLRDTCYALPYNVIRRPTSRSSTASTQRDRE